MATLVLTTAGSLVGGPIGGAIGALLGNRIDRGLLAKGRQGPRLGDLSVQTSSYGSALPRLFGTMRVAGTVIWATDLKEDRHRSGGSKGGGATTSYSYSASFAVALSARPIAEVRRIWADGKLLRGAGGDWKAATGFRLYLGGEDQPVDPLMASAEGIGTTPAHRGLAYAVFEGLQLADFGNRIPALTFEVVADAAPVPVAAIVAELADGAVAGEDGPAVRGFAASGDSVRGAIEALAAAFPLSVCDDGTWLRLGDETLLALDEAAAGAAAEGSGIRHEHARAAADTLPAMVAVTYYEPARDYQAGLQQAGHGAAARAERIELPAAVDADDAKGLAMARLARTRQGRTRRTLALPWRALPVRAGMRVTLADGDAWRVAERRFERMVTTLTLVRDGPAAMRLPAAAGRPVIAADVSAGATILHLLDLPVLGDLPPEVPVLWVAAAGTGAGWRHAELTLSLDGGASWQGIGRTLPPAIVGWTDTALPPGSAHLFDAAGMVEVTLANEGMALAGADDAALLAGGNLALVGDELVQFGRAEQIGPARYRLRRLLRGRRGTEAAIAGHVAGERFVLLDGGALRRVELPVASIGATASVRGAGPDGAIAAATCRIAGRALQPPAPVRLSMARAGDGGLRFAWTRRSRAGWTWTDGSDAPVAEDRERYAVEIVSATAVRSFETEVPWCDYPPELQAADEAGGRLTVRVRQSGTRAPSPPAEQTFGI